MLKIPLQLRAGKVAATVTLSSGSNDDVRKWAEKNKDGQSAILFGSSDMLLMSPDVYEFERLRDEKNVGRTVNNYHAAILRDLRWDGQPRLFRGLSFLRAQRPEYERLTLTQLEQLIGEFEIICAKYDTPCQVLLGYGWADLYLYFVSEQLDPLFAAVVACRAVTLDAERRVGVFRNAFTIVGVDFDRQEQAAASAQLVRPKISLRVEPSELRHLIEHQLPKQFPSKDWKITVTSGKRDIFIIPKDKVPFGTFWDAHCEWRKKIGSLNSPLYKIETHFDFDSEVWPDAKSVKPSLHCECEDSAGALEDAFLEAVKHCDSMGPGLAKSFHGLAHLYLEALDDTDSCCDFDAAAAHYFRQRHLFDAYEQLCERARGMVGEESGEALRVRRERDLIRDVLDRLEISSVFIFHQEQNGSYADLLSRSERVSLYRGGMQKINSVLLTTIDGLIERYRLPLRPMLCWWPAGQIQSERPIGVIKVPVYFLHQPEVAVFLIIHELGQLTAYEFYRKMPPIPRRDEKPPRDITPPVEARKAAVPRRPSKLIELFTDKDVEDTSSWRISNPRYEGDEAQSEPEDDPPQEVPEMELSLAEAERLAIDTGKLMTDMWADVFLLRVGFHHHTTGLLNFLFEQFLQLLTYEKERIPSSIRTVQFMARLISVTAVDLRLTRKGARDVFTPISEGEFRNGSRAVRRYLDSALKAGRFSSQITDAEKNLPPTSSGVPVKLRDVFMDRSVVSEAMRLAIGNSDWVTDSMAYTEDFQLEPGSDPVGLDDLKQGILAQLDPSRIPSYFRAFLSLGKIGSTFKSDEQRTPEEKEEHEMLFLARSALVSSILASCKRKPRLPTEKEKL